MSRTETTFNFYPIVWCLNMEKLWYSYLLINNYINLCWSFFLSRKEEAHDGVLCVAVGDKDDQGEADVSSSPASWRRNCEEDVPQATAVYLPGVRTHLQVLCLLSRGTHKVPSPPPPGEPGHVIRIFRLNTTHYLIFRIFLVFLQYILYYFIFIYI